MKFFSGLAVAVFATILPNLTMAAATEVAPGPDFQGIGYSISSSGEVILYAGVREIGGKTAVCGLIWFEKESATTRAIEPQGTERIKFSIAGKALAINSRQFNRYPTKEDARSGKARCSVSATAWKAEYGKAVLKMKLSAGQIRHY